MLAMTAGLALAGPARAELSPADTALVQRSAEVAQQYWSAAPCAGAVDYGYGALPDGAIGYASWVRPSNAPVDPATFRSCRIDLLPDADLRPAALCTVIVHEVGHLLGRAHSDDPGDVMYPSLGAPLPGCREAFAPPAETSGASVAAETPGAESAPAPPAAKRAVRKARRGAGRRSRARGRGRAARSQAARAHRARRTG